MAEYKNTLYGNLTAAQQDGEQSKSNWRESNFLRKTIQISLAW